MDEVSLMRFYGQIFRDLTFPSKATSEKQKGAVWVCGAEVSADWKTNLGIVHPRNIYICGQFESHFRQLAWWNGLGNLVTLRWQCGVGDLGMQTWQHELDNLAIWTGQISEIKLAKQKSSNVQFCKVEHCRNRSRELENTQANGTYGPWMNKFCWKNHWRLVLEHIYIGPLYTRSWPKKLGVKFEHFWVANWPQVTNKG
jgi:hypothetical protein